MSGAFRRLLAPAKASLNKYLTYCPPSDRLYDENLSKQENLTALHKIEYEIRFYVQKINWPIKQIREQQRNWADLIELIDNDDDKKTEEDLYSEQLQADGAFQEVDRALEKIAELETVLKEIEQLRQMLHQGTFAQSRTVQTTVSSSPNAFGAVSQTWSPGWPRPSFNQTWSSGLSRPSFTGITMPPSSVPMFGTPVCTVPTTVTTTLGPMSNVMVPSMPCSGPPLWMDTPAQLNPALSAPAGFPSISGIPDASVPPAMPAPTQFGAVPLVPPTPHALGGLTPPAAAPAAILPDQQIRLPKMDLPTYDGDPFKWLEFWDVFCSSIHNQMIPDVTKFQYLKSLLRGSAHSAIAGMAVTNDNYGQALQIIHNRFGDTSIIKDALYSQLQALSISGSEPNDVRDFIDTLELIFRQLQSLGEDITQSFFRHLIYGKLPPDILTDIERMKPPHQQWTVESLRNAIWDLVRIRERIQRATQPKATLVEHKMHAHPKPHHPAFNAHPEDSEDETFPSSSTEAFAAAVHNYSIQTTESAHMTVNMGPRQPCVFCGGPHFHADCTEFHSLDSRRKRLIELSRCFLCFREGHCMNKCQSPKRRCPHCQTIGQHNRALCPKQTIDEAEQLPEKFTTPPTVQPPTQPAPVEQSTVHLSDAPNTNIQVGLAVNKVEVKQTKNSTQMMTAKTLIINPNKDEIRQQARLFMDCGSQRTFITKSLADKMELPVVNSECLQVYTFASSAPQDIHTSIVSLDIMYANGMTKTLHANTVPRIIGKQHRDPLSEADIACLDKMIPAQFLSNFPVQTPETYSPDILIGLDYFWEIIEPSQKKQLPSGLHVIPSKFGFLLAGSQTSTVSDNVAQACPVSVGTEVNQTVPKPKPNVACTSPMAQSQGLNIKDFWRVEAIDTGHTPCVSDNNLVEIVTGDAPHGPVIQHLAHQPTLPRQQTTKTTTAQAAPHSHSLKECLYRGSASLSDLCGMLIRFRLNPIAIKATVDTASTVGWVWWPVTNKLRHHIDNVCIGVNTVEEALNFYSESKQIFTCISLNLQEWISNCEEFRRELSEADQLCKENVKILGIPWNIIDDAMKIAGSEKFPQPATTKGEVIQAIAGLYDPLGWVTPVTLAGKRFLQKVSNMNFKADVPLPQELQTEWRHIAESYAALNDFNLRRFIGTPATPPMNAQLHVFVDASQHAYAAAVYLRQCVGLKIYTALLFAKNRLASQDPPSMPQLELMALLIGTRMVMFVQTQLPFPIDDSFVWTGSMSCLQRLTPTKPLSVFAESRLRELHEIKSNYSINFQFVPSAMNPADCTTKGLTVTELQCHDDWWHGPNWLKKAKTFWPSQPKFDKAQPSHNFEADDNTGAYAITMTTHKEQPSLSQDKEKLTETTFGRSVVTYTSE